MSGAEVARQRPLLGLALTLGAAVSYGVTALFARIAYDGAATPLAVICARYWVAVVALALLARVRGVPMGLPAGQRAWGMAVGVLLTFVAYGYLGSVRWIPVGLAALVLYTYPIMVTLCARPVLGQRPTALRWLAALAAFAGVAIVLGVPVTSPDPWGLMLAGLAACSYGAMVLLAGRLGDRVDSLRLTFDASVWAGVFCSVAALILGDVHLPATTLGWTGFVGSVLTFTGGLIMFFAGLPHVGPMRSSGLMNLEPVVAVLAAILLLGETLSPVQGLGAALILLALVPLGR